MSKHSLFSSAAAICLIGLPAAAEISAQAIWDEWVATSSAVGLSVTASDETYAQGVLTLSGIDIESNSPVGASSLLRLDELVLTEQSDGTITFQVSDSMTGTMEMPFGNTTFDLPFNVRLENLRGTITGEDVRSYAYSADRIDVVTGIDGAQAQSTTVITNWSGGAQTSAGTIGPWAYAGNDTVDTLETTFTLDGDGPESVVSIVLNQVNSGYKGQIPATPSADPLLPTGPISGALSFESAATNMRFDAEGEQFLLDVTAGPGTYLFDLTRENLFYGVEFADTTINMQGSELPFPIEAKIGMQELAAAMPLGPTDTPTDIALKLAYRDVTIAEALWNMFDPSAQLSRDPIEVVVNLSGTGRALVDFNDPRALDRLSGPPAEINTLNINELLLSMAGARLSGEGALEFINDGSAYGPGVPQPVGNVAFNLTGAFGLVDDLVNMGMLPAEQGQMAKAMSGMIAKPVADDELVSELEFTPEGGVLANGLPLPF